MGRARNHTLATDVFASVLGTRRGSGRQDPPPPDPDPEFLDAPYSGMTLEEMEDEGVRYVLEVGLMDEAGVPVAVGEHNPAALAEAQTICAELFADERIGSGERWPIGDAFTDELLGRGLSCNQWSGVGWKTTMHLSPIDRDFYRERVRRLAELAVSAGMVVRHFLYDASA